MTSPPKATLAQAMLKQLEVELEAEVEPEGKRDATSPQGSSFVSPNRPRSNGLAEFNAAPASVQDAFFKRLSEEIRRERECEAWLREEVGGDPLAGEVSIPHVRKTQWTDAWQRRAMAVRFAEAFPEDDWTPDRERDPLRDIPARDYVAALTGEDISASGLMRCPLPDHDDLNPSFRVFDGAGWRCYGCGRSGTIYDLASFLWDVPTRGKDFHDLHVQLRGVFAVERIDWHREQLAALGAAA